MTAKSLFLKFRILHHLAVLSQLFPFWSLRSFFQTVVTHFCVWKSNVLSGPSVSSKYMSCRIEKLDDILKFLFKRGKSGVVHDKKVPKGTLKHGSQYKYNLREFTNGQQFFCVLLCVLTHKGKFKIMQNTSQISPIYNSCLSIRSYVRACETSFPQKPFINFL